MAQNYWQQYLDLKQDQKHFYPYVAAQQLGISECELFLSNPEVVYLGSDLRPIVLRLKELGLVECIARNDIAVHEKTGVYENVSMTKSMGIALNVGELDLRIFARNWQHALAVHDCNANYHAIQFFDEFGDSIQKVFLRNSEAVDVWHKLVGDFKTTELPQSFPKAPQERNDLTHTTKLDEKDLAEFHKRWLELKDIHHFDGVLETYGISRLDSYRQAPENHAFSVGNAAIEKAFELARDSGIKIMIFVGNRGIVQIQSGKIHHIVRMHGWLNIMDQKEENFSMHLKDEDLAEVWAVRRPTRDGVVTCLDGFDKQGKSRIVIFGLREEGDPEQTKWQEIVQQIIDANK